MESENLKKLTQLVDELTIRDEEIRIMKETLELVIETSTDGFWDWRIDEDYEYLSPKFKSQLGYSDNEMKNHPSAWQKHIFEEDMAMLGDELHKHFNSMGEHPFEVVCRYNHKNGNEVKILCRGKVIEWNKDGSPNRMVGTHVDITKLINDGKEQ